MIIEPRVRGFICTTAHPAGCAKNVREQIAYVLGQGVVPDFPKRVAVLGCSTGYGLASRIVATFAGGAETIGVSLEREPTATRTGSAGWYNNRAFEIEAGKIGRSPLTLEGDAFSDEMKKDFIDRVREKFGQLDMLVYSMAAPVRTDPDTGKTWRSAIKPLGAAVDIKTLNTETGDLTYGHENLSLASRTPETDVELGYVTTFLDGALALQTNAAYQVNFAGRNGSNAVSFLSRAKIKF